MNNEVSERTSADEGGKEISADQIARPNIFRITFALLHRLFIKSYRDVVAYGIRIVMYLGMCSSLHHPDHRLIRSALSILSGTVWLRLNTTQGSIQPFINSIVSPLTDTLCPLY